MEISVSTSPDNESSGTDKVTGLKSMVCANLFQLPRITSHPEHMDLQHIYTKFMLVSTSPDNESSGTCQLADRIAPFAGHRFQLPRITSHPELRSIHALLMADRSSFNFPG